MVKFSIIIPVFNVEPYLEEALNSVKNQTLDDFEVICINDGSTDNSLAILERFAANDNRFKVYCQENQGPGVARNKAIDMAKGEYIFFVDPDDYIDTNTLEILYSKFKETNAKVIHFDYISFNEKREKLNSFQKRAAKLLNFKVSGNSFYSVKNFKTNNRLANYSLTVWDKAYSREFIQKNDIKCAPNKRGEDNIFSLGMLLLVDKIFYTNEVVYHYRQRIGSTINRASNDNFCVFDNIEYLKDFLVKHNLFEKYKEDFKQYTVNVLNWHYTCIPQASIQRYIDNCSQILSSEENEKFLYKLTHKDKKFIEKIFSLKNWKQYGQKKKVITILGFEFVISTQKGETIERQ